MAKKIYPKTKASAIEEALGTAGTSQLDFNQSINQKINQALSDAATADGKAVAAQTTADQAKSTATQADRRSQDNAQAITQLQTAVNALAGAMTLEGSAPSDEFTAALTNHEKGWAYAVTTAGTYVGQACNVGDFIVCKTTGTAANNADWIVLESNTQDATQAAHGFMSAADKKKLDGISAGAQANPNMFANIKAGSVTLTPDSKTDTLEIAAGTNVQITADAATDKITISATDTKYTLPKASSAALGGVKIGYDENGKNYPVELDTNGKAFVNVPWTDNQRTPANAAPPARKASGVTGTSANYARQDHAHPYDEAAFEAVLGSTAGAFALTADALPTSMDTTHGQEGLEITVSFQGTAQNTGTAPTLKINNGGAIPLKWGSAGEVTYDLLATAGGLHLVMKGDGSATPFYWDIVGVHSYRQTSHGQYGGQNRICYPNGDYMEYVTE